MASRSRMFFVEERYLKKIMPNGVVKICINKEKAKTLVSMLHDHQGKYLSTDLAWQLALIGPYWWLTIHTDVYFANDINCQSCKQQRHDEEIGVSFTIPILATEAMVFGDMRLPYIEYLKNRKLTREAILTQRQQIMIRSRPY